MMEKTGCSGAELNSNGTLNAQWKRARAYRMTNKMLDRKGRETDASRPSNHPGRCIDRAKQLLSVGLNVQSLTQVRSVSDRFRTLYTLCARRELPADKRGLFSSRGYSPRDRTSIIHFDGRGAPSTHNAARSVAEKTLSVLSVTRICTFQLFARLSDLAPLISRASRDFRENAPFNLTIREDST